MRNQETQTVLPSAETAAMLFWALMASGGVVQRGVTHAAGLTTPRRMMAPWFL